MAIEGRALAWLFALIEKRWLLLPVKRCALISIGSTCAASLAARHQSKRPELDAQGRAGCNG